MAWYDTKPNRDHLAYREPGYGGISYPDFVHRQLIDGREAIVGFSATQESQSYVTEQVVELRRFPGIGDHKNSPTRMEMYKEPRSQLAHEKARDYSSKFGNQAIQGPNKGSLGGNGPPAPWSSARDQPEKVHDYSPKFGNQAIQGPNKGSLGSNGPPAPWSSARDQPEKVHDYSPKFGNQAIQGPNKGLLGSNGYRGNGPPAPWSSARDQPEKVNDYSPKFGNQVIHGENKGSPRSPNVNKGNSPSSRNHHPFYTTHDYGKYKNHSSSDDEDEDEDDDDDDDDDGHDDDDITCHDGVCYKNNRGGTKPNHLKEEDNYDKGKHKANNGYAPHSYIVPLANAPPRKDTYHDQTGPLMSNPPPPIKTRGDSNRAVEFPSNERKKSTNSPVSLAAARQPRYSSSSPKKDHDYNYKETIDSAEARRRYGGAEARGGEEMKYKGTIDSIQAAKKYNGVFVPTR